MDVDGTLACKMSTCYIRIFLRKDYHTEILNDLKRASTAARSAALLECVVLPKKQPVKTKPTGCRYLLRIEERMIFRSKVLTQDGL